MRLLRRRRIAQTMASEKAIPLNGRRLLIVRQSIKLLSQKPQSKQSSKTRKLQGFASPFGSVKGLGFFTKGEVTLFMKYAEALDSLFKDYSRPYRWLSRYYEYKRRHQGYTIPLWVKLQLLRKEEIKEAQEMRETQERLV